MKASDVEVGGRGHRPQGGPARISGKVTTVRILEQRVRYDAFRGRERTTWVAVNEATGRQVEIRSAQRLRSRVE